MRRALGGAYEAAGSEARIVELLETLDPLRLLEQIRQAQHQLAILAEDNPAALPMTRNQDLQRFLMSLSTAWHAGEVHPTDRPRQSAPHHWRARKDPLENTWPIILAWFEKIPEEAALTPFRRLQSKHPDAFPANQLRTLQRLFGVTSPVRLRARIYSSAA